MISDAFVQIVVPAADAGRQKTELRDAARKAVYRMRPGDVGCLEGGVDTGDSRFKCRPPCYFWLK